MTKKAKFTGFKWSRAEGWYDLSIYHQGVLVSPIESFHSLAVCHYEGEWVIEIRYEILYRFFGVTTFAGLQLNFRTMGEAKEYVETKIKANYKRLAKMYSEIVKGQARQKKLSL